MASIDKRPDGTYRARWREYPGGPQRTKHFAKKIDAQRHLVEVEHSLMTGRYVTPSAGRTTVAAVAESWLARRTFRPATRDRIEGELRRYVLPAFGPWPVANIRRAHVERWAAELPLAPSSAVRVAETFRTLLTAAVEDELIPRNPAAGARLPSVERAPVVPLEPAQVRGLIAAAPEHLRAAVVLGAGSGLRQGEAAAVTVDRVDFLARTLRVDRQLWTPKAGPVVFAPPKTRRGYRTIALSGTVVDALAAHLAAFGPGGEPGFVFHEDGRPLPRHRLALHMRRTAAAAGVAATWHDLRHAHASTLLSAGVSPALVAERLGHDLKTLLDTYSHVIRSDEDRVRAIVDEALGVGAEDLLRTEAL